MFPFDISLVLRRETLYGENYFFSLQLKPFLITQCNCTSIGLCSTKKTNQWLSGGARAYGYAACQNRQGVWLYKRLRRRISDFFSSATKRRQPRLRWCRDPPLKHLSSRIGSLAVTNLQIRLISCCPVRALSVYIVRSASYRKLELLFVGFGNRDKGGPVTKQWISRWLVDNITLAYSSLGLQCPIGVRAHSTRGIASSWHVPAGCPFLKFVRRPAGPRRPRLQGFTTWMPCLTGQSPFCLN